MEYIVLSVRNARRAARDYGLYTVSLVLIMGLLTTSNLLSVFYQIQGVQSNSLPALMILIGTFLLNYMNSFMLRQRAKEFALYMTMGMERRAIRFCFFAESLLVSILCAIAGGGFSCLAFRVIMPVSTSVLGRAILMTVGWFAVLQITSLGMIAHKIQKLEIVQLLKTDKRNEEVKAEGKFVFWTRIFCLTFGGYVILMTALSAAEEPFMIVSFIALPLGGTVWAFYNMVFYGMEQVRRRNRECLYKGDILLFAGAFLARILTNIKMNSALSYVLIGSVTSYMLAYVLHMQKGILNEGEQQWMMFAQICISIIFLVIYFSVLAIQQAVDAKADHAYLDTVRRIGRSEQEIKKLAAVQIAVKFLLPVAACFLVGAVGVPAVIIAVKGNINGILLLKAAGSFLFIFAVLFGIYFTVTYRNAERIYVTGIGLQ